MKASKVNQKSEDFFSYSEGIISELIADGRYGTAQSYSKALSSFGSFLKGSFSITSIPITDIDDTIIYKYNRYLSARGVIRNSISFYNRTLRAIYNKAIKRQRLPDKQPFADVYTGVDKTSSRAVDEKCIAKLMVLDLSAEKNLGKARDLFIFSYLMRGISFIDMAYLEKDNIYGNRIIYYRKKTGTRIDVRIEPQIRKILEKYARNGSNYLLPILQGFREDADDDNEEAKYRHYQAELAIYNRQLKELSGKLKSSVPLTSYVSRHSWATAARNNNTSISVISEGLGHSSERITRIYLASMDRRIIDSANKKLIDKIYAHTPK